MAGLAEIQSHYDGIAVLHPHRMRDEDGNMHPDYTCAFFNGDFSKPHDQAQRDKHTWIFENLGFGSDLSGKRILDIGCGWGPILHAVRERGGTAVGLTLSEDQVARCRLFGLDARLQDYKLLGKSDLGNFDAIISVGAFEHFCSPTEKQEGFQEDVYRDFFRICAEHLAPGGGLFLQTMTWGKTVPDYNKLSLDAPKNSPESILARLEQFYPGSWLPDGLDQLVQCSAKHFDYVTSSNGRLDYIETLRRWDKATANIWKLRNIVETCRIGLPLLWDFLWNPRLRIQFESVRRSDQRECFIREIMSHERAFFKKKAR